MFNYLLTPIIASLIFLSMISQSAHADDKIKAKYKFNDSDNVEEFEIDKDILQMSKLIDSIILKSGGYDHISETIELKVSSKVFKEIINLLTTAKKELGVKSLMDFDSNKLENTLQKNLEKTQLNVKDLFALALGAYYLGLGPVFNVAVKLWTELDNFGSYDALDRVFKQIPEIQRILLAKLGPQKFVEMMDNNSEYTYDEQEEELYDAALLGQFKYSPKSDSDEKRSKKKIYEEIYKEINYLKKLLKGNFDPDYYENLEQGIVTGSLVHAESGKLQEMEELKIPKSLATAGKAHNWGVWGYYSTFLSALLSHLVWKEGFNTEAASELRGAFGSRPSIEYAVENYLYKS